ncbi:MAG: DUF2167 domain-containing protein, partial [Sedimenticolaceae bacterium]|nr:DUF2167 domain-containing protein [Sedimenticolaceae bacterium]
AFWQSLTLRKGTIDLADGIAVIDVPEGFFFLDAEDAGRVLTDAWGNPPGNDALGMLLPDGMTPFDPGAWAVTITYDETGHISDDGASQLEAGKLLSIMQRDAARESEVRNAEGYESFAVVGWMQQPQYDPASHTLSWGRVLRFGSLPGDTLNVSIRLLGRQGMLSIELVADEAREAEVAKAFMDLISMARFNPGNSYGDFDAASDRRSQKDLAELITGSLP